jgi:hypothetical protein
MQLCVNKWGELIKRSVVPVTPGNKQPRNLYRRLWLHRNQPALARPQSITIDLVNPEKSSSSGPTFSPRLAIENFSDI